MRRRHPAGQTITVRRVALDDRRQPTGEPPRVWDIEGCAIERQATQEVSRSVGGQPSDDYRDTVVTTMKIFLPPGSGLEVTDKIWLPGDNRDHRPMWRLTARPWQARNPFTGQYPGDEILVERVEG